MRRRETPVPALEASGLATVRLCSSVPVLNLPKVLIAQNRDIAILAWIEERICDLKQVLEARTQRSELALRKLLGPISLEPVRPGLGRPYYRARTSLQTLVLLEEPTGSEPSDPGSTSVRWWRRRESNPRPEARLRKALQV